MSFRICYLSNYHNSFKTLYNGTYLGSAYVHNARRLSRPHITSYLFDADGNGLYYDYNGSNRVNIFQVDGENIFYDRKNF